MKKRALLFTIVGLSLMANAETKKIKTVNVDSRQFINNKNLNQHDLRMTEPDTVPVFQTSITIDADGQKKYRCDQLDDQHIHHGEESK